MHTLESGCACVHYLAILQYFNIHYSRRRRLKKSDVVVVVVFVPARFAHEINAIPVHSNLYQLFIPIYRMLKELNQINLKCDFIVAGPSRQGILEGAPDGLEPGLHSAIGLREQDPHGSEVQPSLRHVRHPRPQDHG